MQSVPITNIASSNLAHGKVYLIQHYVMKFVCNLPQYHWNIAESGLKHHKPNPPHHWSIDYWLLPLLTEYFIRTFINAYFKHSFLKTMHACLLPYGDSHILRAVWLDHFWRSCPLFSLEYFIKRFVPKTPCMFNMHAFFKTVHACLSYADSHIIMTVSSTHFWWSYCSF